MTQPLTSDTRLCPSCRAAILGCADGVLGCSNCGWSEEDEPPTETCPTDGGEHDWRDERERYGDDADGNRGVWQNFKRCTKCGEER